MLSLKPSDNHHDPKLGPARVKEEPKKMTSDSKNALGDPHRETADTHLNTRGASL